jgi:hypothetical protein
MRLERLLSTIYEAGLVAPQEHLARFLFLFSERIFVIIRRAMREGLYLPDCQFWTDCRGKPASIKAWRVFRDMYISMVGHPTVNGFPCQETFFCFPLDKGFPFGV